MTADQVALAALLLGGIGVCALAVAAWRLGTILGERGVRVIEALDAATAALDRTAGARRTDTADLPEVDEPVRPTGHRATRAGGGRR